MSLMREANTDGQIGVSHVAVLSPQLVITSKLAGFEAARHSTIAKDGCNVVLLVKGLAHQLAHKVRVMVRS
jgi:hypothetical protein